jgi:hypothetical protein
MSRKYLELFKNGFDSTLDARRSIENFPFIGHDLITGEVVYTIVKQDIPD